MRTGQGFREAQGQARRGCEGPIRTGHARHTVADCGANVSRPKAMPEGVAPTG